jgi:hypothetical protein
MGRSTSSDHETVGWLFRDLNFILRLSLKPEQPDCGMPLVTQRLAMPTWPILIAPWSLSFQGLLNGRHFYTGHDDFSFGVIPIALSIK